MDTLFVYYRMWTWPKILVKTRYRKISPPARQIEVCSVHLSPELCPPLGDDDSEHEI